MTKNTLSHIVAERAELLKKEPMITALRGAQDFNEAQFDLMMKIIEQANAETTSLLIERMREIVESKKKESVFCECVGTKHFCRQEDLQDNSEWNGELDDILTNI